jgi:seryl-tRNA synthetase
MPIDINHFRVEKGGDPEVVRASQRARFADETVVDQIIECDAKLREAKYIEEGARMAKNASAKAAGDRKKKDKKADISDLQAESKAMDAKIEGAKATTVETQALMDKLMNKIGNIVSDKVPIFKDEDNNKVVKTWGEKKEIKVTGEKVGYLHHNQIMECLDIVEFEQGAKVAGHRGYYLKGAGVLLNQALINFGLTTLVKKDYCPLQPPFFMKQEIMDATCQLSDLEENLYTVTAKKDADPLYLTATSE